MIRISTVMIPFCLCAVALPLVVGCDLIPHKVSAHSAAPAKPGDPDMPQVDDQTIAENDAPAKDAPSPKSQPIGVLVAYPVPDKAVTAKDARDFTTGIGFYLTDAVAGAPEFGQTPLQSTVMRVAWERKLPTLHLSVADALRVARASGVTHIATAEYSEVPGSVTLTYHVQPVPANGQPAIASAPPLQFSAKNRDALVKQLPKIAQEIRAALSNPSSVVSVPPLDGISADTMTKLGSCWRNGRYTDEQTKFIREAGRHMPLAAQIAVYVGTFNVSIQAAKPYADVVLKGMPLNTQALGSLGKMVPKAVKDNATLFYKQSDTYPDNYVLAHTAAWVARSGEDWNRDQQYAMRCSEDAPANPEARLSYGWTLGEQAGRIRQGRFYGQMDSSMTATIEPLYKQWYEEVKAATLCDPLYGKAYERLAQAATFASYSSSADDAMTMARKLNKDDPYDTYSWAIQMYDSKWGGSAWTWHKVAVEATTAHYNTTGETVDIYEQLGNAGLTQEQTQMRERLVKESEAAIAKNPMDDDAHYIHGKILESYGRRGVVTPDFVAMAKNNPQKSWAQFELGHHYIILSHFKDAEAALKRAKAIDPDDVATLSWLGYAQKQEGKYAEAEVNLKKALSWSPGDMNTLIRLGVVLCMEKKYKEAIPILKQAQQIRSDLEETNLTLAWCYIGLDRYKEAVDIGEAALDAAPNSLNAKYVLGQAYPGNKQWDKAEETNKSILQSNPGDAYGHAYLGDTYEGRQDTAAAHKEWQTALGLHPDADLKQYVADQIKKYPAH